jgi:hypothetical protein
VFYSFYELMNCILISIFVLIWSYPSSGVVHLVSLRGASSKLLCGFGEKDGSQQEEFSMGCGRIRNSIFFFF